MARDFDGANDHIDFVASTTIENATTLAFSGWVYQDNITKDHAVFDFTAAGVGVQLYFDDVGSASGRTDTFKVTIDETGADSAGGEWSTGAGTQNAWQHIFLGMECGSATGCQFWVNGVEDALSPLTMATVSDLGNSTTVIRFGESQGATRDRNGKLAELAFWTRIPTDDEIKALAKGFSPLHFPTGLKFYAPLIGQASPEPDLMLGNQGTVTGAVAFSHPRMIYPSASQMRRFTTAGGAPATSIKDLIGGFIPFAR